MTVHHAGLTVLDFLRGIPAQAGECGSHPSYTVHSIALAVAD